MSSDASLIMPYIRSVPKIFGAELFDHQHIINIDNIHIERFNVYVEDVLFHYSKGKIIFNTPSIKNVNLLSLVSQNSRYLCAIKPHVDAATPLVFDGRPVIIMVFDGMDIYGHWIVDFAPKIRAFKTFFRNIDVAIAIPYDAPKYAKFLLEIIFGQGIFFVDIYENINYSSKVFFSNDTRKHDFLSEFSVDRSNVTPLEMNLCSSSDSSGNSGRFYLSRKNFRDYRSLLNCQQIENAFLDRGFEIVVPEDLSLRDQFLLFSGADMIAGEAGSALHNCIFSPSSTKFLNLQSSRQNHFIQSSLCWWGGQCCIYIVGQSNGLDWNADFSVDVNEVHRAIDYLEVKKSPN